MLQHSLQGFSTALDCRRTHRRAQGLHRCPQAPRVVQTCVISAGRRRSRPALDVLDQHSVLGDTADHAVFDRAQNGSAPEPLKALIDRILNEEFQALGPLVLPSTDSDDESAEPRQQRSNTSSSEDTEDSKDTETCVVAHPGSLCCSTTTISRQPSSKSVVIELKTTVKLSNPDCKAISMADLEQLGFVTTAQQLQQAAGSMARTGSRNVQKRHDAVLRVLTYGHVVHAEKSTNQFGHVTYRCTLEDPETQNKVEAIVKPSIEGHCHGWHRAEIETVTYRLNRLLGMDYVPPCVYRKEMDVDWQHFNGGTFMYWAESGRELRSEPMHQWGANSEVVLSDARILDVLIQNSDRHHGHFLFAEHWAKGNGATNAALKGWKGTMLPVFIDHAAGFRPEAVVEMRHENAFNTGAATRISARTYLRLRCLSHSAVAESLDEMLTPSELDQLMRRRDDVLRYFDELVAEKGYEDVVIDC